MYRDTERQQQSPQTAIRVAVIGGIALAMFAVIFFRLWYLQILSGDRHKSEANDNRVREIKVQAPRGEILDREGRVLVDNRPGLALKISPDKLPKDTDDRTQLYERLAHVLGTRPRIIDSRVKAQLKALPFSGATVKTDVDTQVVQYVLENQEKLPGVTIERVFLRSYPHKQVGAHLFGTVGEVTKEQLDDKRYRSVTQGDRVGQSGIEFSYDRFLRGRNGANRLQVDALGTLEGELARREPVQGRDLRLTVDLDVQEAGQKALGGTKGAFVVMDIKSGEIRALGSSPAFDPNIFAKGIREADYKRLTSKDNGEPLANRAIQGLYPTGSTWKLVTAVAALQGGIITPSTIQVDGGSITVGGITFKNAGDAVHGAIALPRALEVSSDVFFYKLGLEANGQGDGKVIQRWAGRLGLGHKTGIDLPGESEGLVPSPEWRNDLFKKKLTDRPWSVGDNINLSVGQGDLQANPLQLAVAYGAVANGGFLIRPHLGKRLEDAEGRVLQEFDQPARKRVDIKPEHRQAILEGLRLAASGENGTSTDVFEGFPVPIAGKTGTAERGLGRADQSWYVALAPYPNPRYVVAVTDEAGGFGAESAAPKARQLLAALYDIKGDSAPAGKSRTF